MKDTPQASETYPGTSPTDEEATAGDVQPQPPLDEDSTEEIPGPASDYEEDESSPQ